MDLRIPIAPLPAAANEAIRLLIDQGYEKVPMLYGPIRRWLDEADIFRMHLEAERLGFSRRVDSLPAIQLDIAHMSVRTFRKVAEEIAVLQVSFDISKPKARDLVALRALADWASTLYEAVAQEGERRRKFANQAELN
jgi:hypothetical protein